MHLAGNEFSNSRARARRLTKVVRMGNVIIAFKDGSAQVRLDPDRIVSRFVPPQSLDRSAIGKKVASIVDGPDSVSLFPLTSVVLPGDSVAIPLSGNVGDAATIAADLVAAFAAAGMPESAFRAVCPAEEADEYRHLLPASISVVSHDPATEESSAYLSNTRRGSRIYLNRDLLDCDVILPVLVPEPTGLAANMGFLRGFWPEFSRLCTRVELEAHFRADPRRVRHEIREVAWLAGVPVVIIGLPGEDGPTEIAARQLSDVQAWVHHRFEDEWGFRFDDSADSVLLVANETQGLNERRAIRLLKLARKLAVRYRRLVIWSRFSETTLAAMMRDLAHKPGAGTSWIAPLKKAGRSANVSFLGNLPDEIADECDIVMLDEPEDIERQVNRSGRWLVVPQAWGVRARFPD